MKEREETSYDLSRHPIVIIATLFIALFGGVPGMIDVYNKLFAAPKFSFETSGMNIQEITTSHGSDAVAIILAGTMYNSGKKSLLLKNIYLLITYNGKTDTIIPRYIPRILDSQFVSNSSGIITNLENTNLTHIDKLEPSDSRTGSLFFELPYKIDNLKDWTKNTSFGLLCQDVPNNLYFTPIHLGSEGNNWFNSNTNGISPNPNAPRLPERPKK